MARRLTKVAGVVALLVLASSSVDAKTSGLAVSRGLLQAGAADPSAADGSAAAPPAEDNAEVVVEGTADDAPADNGDAPAAGSQDNGDAPVDNTEVVVGDSPNGKKPAGASSRVAPRPVQKLNLPPKKAAPVATPKPDPQITLIQNQIKTIVDAQAKLKAAGKPVPVNPQLAPLQKKLTELIVAKAKAAAQINNAKAPQGLPARARLVLVEIEIKKILAEEAKLKAAGKPVPVNPKLKALQATKSQLTIAVNKANSAGKDKAKDNSQTKDKGNSQANSKGNSQAKDKGNSANGGKADSAPRGAGKAPTKAKVNPALVKINADIALILTTQARLKAAGKPVPANPRLTSLLAAKARLEAQQATAAKKPIVKDSDDGDMIVVEDSDDAAAVDAPQDDAASSDDSTQASSSSSWAYAPVAACGALVTVFAAGIVVYRRRARAAYANLLDETPAQGYQTL